MKMRHRALTLLLTIAMLITFMPAMAFAEAESDETFDVPMKGISASEESAENHKSDDYHSAKGIESQELSGEEMEYTWADTDDVVGLTLIPSSFSLYSEDIKTETGLYDFWYRSRTIAPDGSVVVSPFAVGDRAVLTYSDGSQRVFVNTIIQYDGDYSDFFISGNEFIWPDLRDDYLEPGNNSFKAYVGEAYTIVTVFVDTPEMRAQRAAAAEAARQGTYVAGLPKIKISKPKAAKKAVTVKWKKLTKKQLKKGVTGIEIWICPNAAFGPGDTKIVNVGKKKSSKKIKLAKGTYFVKVRAIKNAGGVKYYTAWSKTKKVKIKK